MKISVALLPCLCLCLGLLETFTTGLDKSCPLGWHKKPGNNCYHIGNEFTSFDEAKLRCESMNSQLFPVASRHDQNQLISLLGKESNKCGEEDNCHAFWIGVRTEILDWTSVDGKLIEKENQIWAPGYPADESGGCVFLSVQKQKGKNTGHWKNEDCARSLKFVCFSKAQPKKEIPSVDPDTQGKYRDVAPLIMILIKALKQLKYEIMQEANEQTAEQAKEFRRIDRELKHIRAKVDIQLLKQEQNIKYSARIMKAITKDIPENPKNKSVDEGCPDGFDYVPEIDQCLYLNQERHTWRSARDACAGIATGAQMLMIKDSVKQEAVRKYLRQKFTRQETDVCVNSRRAILGKIVWLGGQTADPDQCNTPYVWKPSEADETPFTYTNWQSGSPNCYYKGENCAIMATSPLHNYQWKDFVCKAALCSVCEI